MEGMATRKHNDRTYYLLFPSKYSGRSLMHQPFLDGLVTERACVSTTPSHPAPV